ncbi:MAG: prolipoprotein diacylglyceryl transferase [Chitinophagales bacterium]|nr:prolipoprotein diacylglyceryl transferase [Chitinophagales bacterium]
MFPRCYPTISDLLYDFTGIDIPLPIFSYGFCLALGFLFAAWTLSIELKRKEKHGILKPFKQTIEKGEKATPLDLIISALIGALVGYKLVYVLFNWSAFADNPQEKLFSAEGSILGAIVVAGIFVYLKYRNKAKEVVDHPQSELVEVHPYQAVGDLTIVAAITGIIGAKLFYFFESPGNFEEFLNDPFGSFFGGLTVYGGLILGSISVMWFAKKRGMNPVHIADAASPGLFLAYVFGRQGCQVSGDGDWGIVNTLTKPDWLGWLPDRLWAFNYPHNIINEGVRIPDCMEAHCYVLPEAVFPTPMYESFMALALFALLWSLRKHITIPGLMFSFYFILNGIERYLIEQVRVNTKLDMGGTMLTQAEVIAILFSLFGIGSAIYFYRKNKASS